jgi:cyclic pyranopterin phosphate synthase
MEFTHFDSAGNAVMVDVGAKADTERIAVASGRISMSRECFEKVKEGSMKKGDVLGVARVAGIMGAKQCSQLIPLCHLLNLTNLTIDFALLEESCEIEARCTAKTTGKTGVEMEALTGTSVALLTIYDMCKAVDKTMEIGQICLEEKSGGKSGHFYNPKKTARQENTEEMKTETEK